MNHKHLQISSETNSSSFRASREGRTRQERRKKTPKKFYFLSLNKRLKKLRLRCCKSVALHLCAQKNRLISFLMKSEKRSKIDFRRKRSVFMALPFGRFLVRKGEVVVVVVVCCLLVLKSIRIIGRQRNQASRKTWVAA